MSAQQRDVVFGLAVGTAPGGQVAIYAAGEGGIDRSLDLGATWTRLWSGGVVASVVEFHNAAGGRIVAGVDSGVVWSDNWGDTWTLAALPGARSIVGCLSAACTHGSVSYVLAGTVEDGVYRSTDTGLTWTPSNTGLYIPRTTAILARDQGLCLVGTDAGLFSSSNQGITWSDDLAEEIYADVTAVVASDDFLIVGTASDGLLAHDTHLDSWRSVAGSEIREEAIALRVSKVDSQGGELIAITSMHAQRFSLERDKNGLSIELRGQATLAQPAVCASIYMSNSETYAVLAHADGTIANIPFPSASAELLA